MKLINKRIHRYWTYVRLQLEYRFILQITNERMNHKVIRKKK